MTEPVNLVPLIRQKLAWDMLPVNHDYWDVLNLVPPSEEIAPALTAESADRMRTVQVFVPFVEMYSVLAADIMTQVLYKNMLVQADTTNPMVANAIEQWHKQLVNQNRELVRGAVYPILAAMLEAKVIDYGSNGEPDVLLG